ncbi:hypothetical protein COU57_06515 [Candidatus Pacearchaeota archaeon CG10_big_fil_rev_8_21_14_0_10_32_14]|nr:MAG: hypothetical protein COU57_06515 [Candidatus Pacearchaeota archaeon CG10_big_fil_rev_8_21_14_0_10_32_14]
MLGQKTELQGAEKGFLEHILDPVSKNIDQIVKRKGEPDKSFCIFCQMLLNQFYQSAQQIAIEEKYPYEIISYLSNGRLREQLKDRREIYLEV